LGVTRNKRAFRRLTAVTVLREEDLVARPGRELLFAEVLKVPLALLDPVGVVEDIGRGAALLAQDLALALGVAGLDDELEAHSLAVILRALELVQLRDVGIGQAGDEDSKDRLSILGDDGGVVLTLDAVAAVAFRILSQFLYSMTVLRAVGSRREPCQVVCEHE
jgi:hypothetical protein